MKESVNNYEVKTCIAIIMNVIKGLCDECKKHERCSNCKLENKNGGVCYFRACPCYYELDVIEEAITQILKEEIKEQTE